MTVPYIQYFDIMLSVSKGKKKIGRREVLISRKKEKKNGFICRIVMSASKEYDLCRLYITLHKDKSGVLEGKL